MKNGKDLIALDFFTVPTATFRVLFVLVVLSHRRRRMVHFDHVVIVGERHLLEILSNYVDYYNETRTHLALAKDGPEPRSAPAPSQGRVVEVPRVGGLHHEYLRKAA